MIIRKNPSVSLKLRYPITVRATLLVSVVLLITLLVAFPKFEAKSTLEKEVHVDIEQFDIPQTQQFELPPPPSRPAVPVESENEDLADDVTIEETELDDFVSGSHLRHRPKKGHGYVSFLMMIHQYQLADTELFSATLSILK